MNASSHAVASTIRVFKLVDLEYQLVPMLVFRMGILEHPGRTFPFLL
jgi:hypothetical protein